MRALALPQRQFSQFLSLLSILRFRCDPSFPLFRADVTDMSVTQVIPLGLRQDMTRNKSSLLFMATSRAPELGRRTTGSSLKDWADSTLLEYKVERPDYDNEYGESYPERKQA